MFLWLEAIFCRLVYMLGWNHALGKYVCRRKTMLEVKLQLNGKKTARLTAQCVQLLQWQISQSATLSPGLTAWKLHLCYAHNSPQHKWLEDPCMNHWLVETLPEQLGKWQGWFRGNLGKDQRWFRAESKLGREQEGNNLGSSHACQVPIPLLPSIPSPWVPLDLYHLNR